MKENKRKLFFAFDVIIIIIVLVSAAVALLSQFNKSEEDLCCVIRQNGEVVHSVELSQVSDTRQIELDNKYKITVYVNDHSVFVKSSCPDKLCEHTGPISKQGQSIVCLPAKVSVTLESNENAVDVVVG